MCVGAESATAWTNIVGMSKLMPNEIRLHRRRTEATSQNNRRPSHASLEATREALLQRLEHLGPGIKHTSGYKSAMRLLNAKFRLATLSARVGVLQAAAFMIDVLERTLPLL